MHFVHGSAARTLVTMRRERLVGVLMMLGSGLSTQVGASVAALAFPAIGPAGVVATRQWVAGIVLVASERPGRPSIRAQLWRPIIGLAAVFAVMNLSLY